MSPLLRCLDIERQGWRNAIILCSFRLPEKLAVEQSCYGCDCLHHCLKACAHIAVPHETLPVHVADSGCVSNDTE